MKNLFKGKYSPVALNEGVILGAMIVIALLASGLLWLVNLFHH
jgi:hypothetical protein